MLVLPSMDFEVLLIYVVRHTVIESCVEDHLGASNVVEHRVSQLGLQVFFIHAVEVDFVFRNNLETFVTLGIGHKPFDFQGFIQYPLLSLKFEKRDLLRSLGNQSFIINQKHLAQDGVRHVIVLIHIDVLDIGVHKVSLPIKHMQVSINLVKEAFVREVFLGASHSKGDRALRYFAELDVISEVDVLQFGVIMQCNEDLSLGDPSVRDIRVCQPINDHNPIIDPH